MDRNVELILAHSAPPANWEDEEKATNDLTASALGLLAIEQQLEEVVVIPARRFALAFDACLNGFVLAED